MKKIFKSKMIYFERSAKQNKYVQNTDLQASSGAYSKAILCMPKYVLGGRPITNNIEEKR